MRKRTILAAACVIMAAVWVAAGPVARGQAPRATPKPTLRQATPKAPAGEQAVAAADGPADGQRSAGGGKAVPEWADPVKSAQAAQAGIAWMTSLKATNGMPTFKPYKGKLDFAGAVETPGFEGDVFMIACWVPSFFDLEKWAKRGINVAWFNQGLNPREKTLQEYVAKANSVGIKMWRYPAEHMQPKIDPKFDEQDPTLIAYSLIDEPILHRMSPEDVMNQAKAFREASHKPLKLILNVEGDKIDSTPPKHVAEQHAAYMEACDIGFLDWYVKNRNAGRYPLRHLWTAVENLIVWGKGKPVGAFVECSNQKIGELGREPTPGEMRGEIVGSIIYGARLIAYFPEVPGREQNKGVEWGDANDGTPPNLEAELVVMNKALQTLAPVLHANGARLTTLPEPLIGAVRWHKGKTYLIVFNDDPEETTAFNGEKIEPYGWRVFDAGPAPKGKDQIQKEPWKTAAPAGGNGPRIKVR